MIKTLLFDFGGVLVDLDRRRCIEAFRRVGFDIEPYLGAYRQGGMFAQFENGDITTHEFCESLRRAAGNDVSDEAYIAAWESYLTEVPAERLDMLLRLKERYRLAVLSNTNAVHWRMAEERLFHYRGLSLSDFFGDRIFLSNEMHLQKPDPAIFHRVAEALGEQPGEVLFLDDSIVNCEAARRCGMQAEVAGPDSAWLPLAEQLLQAAGDGRGAVVTIGFFDGVHRGHQYLLSRVKAEALRRGLRSVAVTFGSHPRQVLHSDYVPQLLTTTAEKRGFIERSGIDECVVLDFTADMARLTAAGFMQEYLIGRLGARCLVMGYDHHFGSDRLTSFGDYRRAGETLGLEVLQMPAAPLETDSVSSSAVRRCLLAGDVEGAALRLGRSYALGGCVVEGHRVGRTLGYPTANLRPDEGKLIPAPGVYATHAVLNGQTYAAMTNIGTRPTLDNGTETSVETHLIGYDGDAYGRRLELHFERRLRDEKKYDSIDSLRLALRQDEAAVRAFFKL